MKQNYKNIVSELSKTYTITAEGECVNIKRNKVVVFPIDKKGYHKTRLWCPEISKNKDKRIPMRLHRLVAMYHLKNFKSELQINHKNGIKTDNRVENLEIVNNQQNAWHGWNVLNSKKRRLAAAKRTHERGIKNFDKYNTIIKCPICGKERKKFLRIIRKDPKNWKRYCSWKCFMKSKFTGQKVEKINK